MSPFNRDENSKNVHKKLIETYNFFFLPKRPVHKLRWKHINRINPLMYNKNLT